MISFTGHFGFIDSGGEHVYFIAGDAANIRRGDDVRFNMATVDGRPRAVDVRVVDPVVAEEVDRVLGT
ncbi:hypothetical protein [Aquamicrobium soli]|uniref:Cold shock domain-containing protein n=1 Tax=Aquamicrobium soli TaxID=1811518 RepID=A0ABV7KC72_9HYPH